MVGKIFEMRNVSVVRGGRRILDSVSLDIGKGESLAVIGPNGSGKTTLLKLFRGDIFPFYDPEDPPEMRILGRSDWSIFDLRRMMGIVSMDLQERFRPDTKVFEVIASGHFGSLDIFRNMEVTEEMVRKTCEKAALMGIEDLLDRELEGLSLGEMRRALIARALVTDPEILVLDEPMTGLDIVMASRFRRMFDILIGRGVNIMMVTHDLADIPSGIDRVVVMKEGRKFSDGSKSEVLGAEAMSEVYGEPINVEAVDGVYRMYPG